MKSDGGKVYSLIKRKTGTGTEGEQQKLEPDITVMITCRG